MNNTLRLVSRDFRFKQPACENKHVCTHNCKHAPRLARTQQQGIKYGGVGNACNLPAGKLWQETSAVRETIMGGPAHKETYKSRETMCDCMCECRGRGSGNRESVAR